MQAEHSCRACWAKKIPCGDNSPNALLTDERAKNQSLGPNKGFKDGCEFALQPRSNYRATAMFAQLAGSTLAAPLHAGAGCSGMN